MNIAKEHFAGIGIALLIAAALGVGCGDMATFEEPQGTIESNSSALVTPKFVVVGYQSLPEEVSVDDFEVDVGDLRLLEADPRSGEFEDPSESAMAAMMVTLNDEESSHDNDGGDDHGNPLPLPVEPDDGSEDEESQRNWLPMAAADVGEDEPCSGSDGDDGTERPVITFDIGAWYDETRDEQGEIYGSTADEEFQIDGDAIAGHSSVIMPGDVGQ